MQVELTSDELGKVIEYLSKNAAVLYLPSVKRLAYLANVLVLQLEEENDARKAH
jgi:hypothetical protein